jgi:hypothetical protein
MILLDDPIWKELEGGYRKPYDASIALRKLETAETSNAIDEVFKEFWQELHHQGDVGSASYYSVPQIIRIAKKKKILHFNVFGLIAVIEIERHSNNPKLPSEFEQEYLQAIREGIPDLISMILKDSWDITLSSTAMAALAVSKGHNDMAKAILKMEDTDIIKEFLEIY